MNAALHVLVFLNHMRNYLILLACRRVLHENQRTVLFSFVSYRIPIPTQRSQVLSWLMKWDIISVFNTTMVNYFLFIYFSYNIYIVCKGLRASASTDKVLNFFSDNL